MNLNDRVRNRTEVSEILKRLLLKKNNNVGGGLQSGDNVSELVNDVGYLTSLPYKVYTAIISQTGTNNPTLVVLENTTGQTITATRSNAGRYSLNVTGSILLNAKTWWTITNDNNNGFFFYMNKETSFGNTNTIYIDTATLAGVYTDGILQSTPIEIKVYN